MNILKQIFTEPLDEVEVATESEADIVIEEDKAIDMDAKFTPAHITDMAEADLVASTYAIENYDQAIDQCLDVIAGLEEFKDTVEALLPTGGLEAKSSMMVEVALESIGTCIGLSMTESLPGLEAYTVAGGRVAATEAIVESIKSGIKKTWTGIKTLIVKFILGLRNFYRAHLQSIKGLLGNVKALIAKTNKAKEVSSGSEISVSDSFAKNMVIPSGSNLIKEMDRIGEHLTELLLNNEYGVYLKEMYDTLTEYPVIGKAGYDQEKATETKKEILSKLAKLDLTEEKAFKLITADMKEGATDTYTSKTPYIGGLMVTIVHQPQSLLHTPTLKIGTINYTPSVKTKYDALSNTDIVSHLKALVNLLTALIAHDKEWTKRLNLIESYQQECDAIIETYYIYQAMKYKPDESDISYFKLVKSRVLNFKAMTETIYEPATALQVQALASAKAIYALCESSLIANSTAKKES